MSVEMLHLCHSCALAFKVDATGGSSHDDKREVATAEPLAKRSKLIEQSEEGGKVCQHCLGLLDKDFQKEIVQSVRERLEAENYVDVLMYNLCVHVSPALIVQNHIVKQFIHKATSAGIAELPSDDFVKEQLKISLVKAMETALGSLKPKNTSGFLITLNFQHTEADTICKQFITGTVKQLKQKMKQMGQKSIMNMRLVQTAVEGSNYGHLSRLGLLPHQATCHAPCTYNVALLQKSLFLGGRYNKYSRVLSQTPWFVNGVRKAELSVQDLIVGPVQEAFRSDNITFSSSGREDVDVRMLGSGRPFMLEVGNPRDVSAVSRCGDLEAAINSGAGASSIAVSRLQQVDQKHGSALKDGEESKRKRYCALVWSSAKVTPASLAFLDNITDLTLAQKTPLRVLHRRSAATRSRTIASLKAHCIDDQHFKLDIVAQSGTYIKEFVHGDFGRTVPNLCTILGHNVDILALDVTDIDLAWPPPSSSPKIPEGVAH